MLAALGFSLSNTTKKRIDSASFFPPLSGTIFFFYFFFFFPAKPNQVRAGRGGPVEGEPCGRYAAEQA